ncbi:MAG: MSMEG_1061 family FMN-dependent PPOX-type flavoprotein [Pseudomonadota bacterium]
MTAVRTPVDRPSETAVPDDVSLITDEATLRALHPTPLSRATNKVLPAIDDIARAIIARSRFCLLATQGPNGADVTPRGDPAGFVKVLDVRTLLIPDRVGNNRLDSMVNILHNPRVGLLFLVPGMGETLRINGRAQLTDDARLLASCAVRERVPKVGVLVTVDEVFVHCSKALVRAKLWDAGEHIDRETLPSYSHMLMVHADNPPDVNAEQDRIMAERGLY